MAARPTPANFPESADRVWDRPLTLFALALGSFAIGTSAFASMGIIQLFSQSLNISLPQATWAISAYAAGVVIGAPLLTIGAAQMNRRTLLVLLMSIFLAGSVLSALAQDLATLLLARFISGIPHGAYFGAGAVVATYVVGPGHGGKAFAVVMAGLTVATVIGAPTATYIGQIWGWREAYATVATLATAATVAIYLRVPRTEALNGRPVSTKITALRSRAAWGLMAVAATGVSSIFAVYTVIAPMITEVAGLPPGMIPVALAVFGVGMTVGNAAGGVLADRFATLGITLGYGCALGVLVALAMGGAQPVVLLACLFGVGASIMAVIPTVQVRLIRFAPEAPSLMGALNVASLNVANGLGAWVAGATVGSGMSYLSTAWSGFALTALGLFIFVLILQRHCKEG
ncbi:MFS transporter [Shinella sp.]|uniref:MFS transporter n=1 Tax=Shinella sp. TaxID=1870904 RepID=UPI0029A281E4|nr:MFS transporter [Shinella sp.]MDX3975364.1 MFS transporter [Shinella sp.]